MHQTHLRKVGGSVMLAIPPALLEQLQLQAGAAVDIGIDDGQLVIKPQPSPRYNLADLLAQCDPNAPRDAEEGKWLDTPAIGNELL